MRRILLFLIAGCLLYGVGTVAATGQFVVAHVEAFESWGVLNWGSWNTMDEELLATRLASLPAEDSQRIDEARVGCETSSDLDQDAAGSCESLERFHFVRQLTYDIDPLLGRSYRVRLQNLTAGYLGIVLSVDGLNSNGNKPVVGDATDRKWILRPFQTVTISGWQISADEALQFAFGTPSQSHSALEALRGTIRIDVYLNDPLDDHAGRGTEAGALIDQPTVSIPFASVTDQPVETLAYDYSRDHVVLGIQCAATDGAGIRVTAVVQGTPADQAGLRAGDIITYVNAVPINTCSDLQALLSTKRPGDHLVLKVHRPDRVFLATLELEE